MTMGYEGCYVRGDEGGDVESGNYFHGIHVWVYVCIGVCVGVCVFRCVCVCVRSRRLDNTFTHHPMTAPNEQNQRFRLKPSVTCAQTHTHMFTHTSTGTLQA